MSCDNCTTNSVGSVAKGFNKIDDDRVPTKPVNAIPAAFRDLSEEQDKLGNVLEKLCVVLAPILHKREVTDDSSEDRPTRGADIELRKEVVRSEGGSELLEAVYSRRDVTIKQVKLVLELLERVQV